VVYAFVAVTLCYLVDRAVLIVSSLCNFKSSNERISRPQTQMTCKYIVTGRLKQRKIADVFRRE